MNRYYGQFDPPVDKFIYDNFFANDPKIDTGFFIECGAFDGVIDSSCKFFEETLGWKGINIEAAPPIFEKLCTNRPNSTNYNLALSDFNGKAEFTHAIHPELGTAFGNGSLRHTDEHKRELDEKGCTYQKFEVEVVTYPRLIEMCNIAQLDLFVLDVEGAEISVIRSMKESTVLPSVFCVEHGNVGQQLIVSEVEQLGYRFVCDSYVNSFFVRK